MSAGDRERDAEELAPVVKRAVAEAHREWPDDREYLIAQKILASDWLAAHDAKVRAEGAREVAERVEAVGSFDAFLTVAPMARVRVMHEHEVRAALKGGQNDA